MTPKEKHDHLHKKYKDLVREFKTVDGERKSLIAVALRQCEEEIKKHELIYREHIIKLDTSYYQEVEKGNKKFLFLSYRLAQYRIGDHIILVETFKDEPIGRTMELPPIKYIFRWEDGLDGHCIVNW